MPAPSAGFSFLAVVTGNIKGRTTERFCKDGVLYDKSRVKTVPGAASNIRHKVEAWSGVSVQPHRFGGVEFRLGRRELGHLHGDSLLDIPFPMDVRNDLISRGRVQRHHILPESGWVSFHIHTDEDREEALQLLRRSYDLASTAAVRRRKNESTTIEENQQS